MADRFSLAGRIALITGGSRGIGFAMARALADHGATVWLNARKSVELEKAVEKLREFGHSAHSIACDVTDAAATRDMFAKIEAAHGGLDILVNNAGVQHRKPLLEWEDGDFERVVALNLNACFRLAREAARGMKPRGKGRIINTGSISAILARPTIHAYIAAKAGLHGLTRSLAVELGPTGITVNAIAPGYTATELNQALIDDKAFSAWVEKRTPMARWATPDEIAGAAVFLASDAASFITGHTLVVDGGMSISL